MCKLVCVCVCLLVRYYMAPRRNYPNAKFVMITRFGAFRLAHWRKCGRKTRQIHCNVCGAMVHIVYSHLHIYDKFNAVGDTTRTYNFRLFARTRRANFMNIGLIVCNACYCIEEQ